jgi:DNA repair protein RecO (recombination protein O)
MKTILTRGLLIRKQPYRETSILGLWFTDTLGPCRALVLGAHRPKSPHLHQLDLFYSHELLLTNPTHSKLPIVKEIKIIQPHLHLRRDSITLATIKYFCDLCESVSEPGAPAHEISELLHKAAQFLNQKPPPLKLLRHFERAIMQLSGLSGKSEFDFLSSMHSHQYKIPPLRSKLYNVILQPPPSLAPPHIKKYT